MSSLVARFRENFWRDPLQGEGPDYWVAVKELKLNYHNSETLLFTDYPYYGNLISLTATQLMVSIARYLRYLKPLAKNAHPLVVSPS